MSGADPFAALQAAVAGQWSLERELGAGGMGTVYLARDVALDRPVAIKLLHPALAAEPHQRERFLREARTGARLSHPHIVPIYDVVEAGSLVFFVMALVDGESVGQRLRREGPLPAPEAARILREVGWALAAAHAAGVLHRDVTLDNILLERRTGRALLVDFGIAEEIDGGEAGPLVGTAAYLAPELIRGDPASPASELYALGIVGWAMLTGRLPFLDEEPGRVLLRHLTEEIPPLARAAARTPSRLIRAVESLLVKEPTARPASVEAWLATLDGHAPTPRLAEPLRAWLTQRDAMRPFYALAVTSLGMLGPAAALIAGALAGSPVGAVVTAIVVGATALAAIQVGAAVRRIRRATREGYRIEDLRLALARHVEDRHLRGPEPPTALGRTIRWGGRVAAVTFVVILAMIALGRMPSFLPWWLSVWLWQRLYQVLAWSWMLHWASRGLGFIIPGTTLPVEDRRLRWRQRFWHSPLGRGFHRIATVGIRTGDATTTLHRPTELVLGLQIEDVWRTLPAETRRGLDDLPAIAEALRARVAELRRILALLDRPGAADESTVRDRLESHRDLALATLERLRLLALRLAGETAPEGEFTRHLRDAREVELALLQDLGGHPDVLRAIGRERSPSPVAG